MTGGVPTPTASAKRLPPLYGIFLALFSHRTEIEPREARTDICQKSDKAEINTKEAFEPAANRLRSSNNAHEVQKHSLVLISDRKKNRIGVGTVCRKGERY